jgi:VWFA-related protein
MHGFSVYPNKSNMEKAGTLQMRKLILAGLLMVVVLPAGAAKRVTVAQFEQFLATETADHRPDAEIARRVGDLELSERLSEVMLGRIAKNLAPGPRTALAVQLLADQSAFLDPPANELPATAPPDAAAQVRMMDMARGYVVQTWPHLPDFFVTRTTARFNDAPQVLEKGDWPVRAGMHLLGVTTEDLTYRNGQEVPDSDTETAAASSATPATKAAPVQGLSTRGEFAPELPIVLTDMAKGTVTWSHWEATSAGLAAVYHYSVPRNVSHFEVNYCCLSEAAVSVRSGGSATARRAGGNTQIPVQPAPEQRPFRTTPGYHGTIYVNPATGAIVRVTLEAELKADDPIIRAATVVQYGPVTIGDKRYILPVRSLAFSMEQVNPRATAGDTPILLLNETSFTHYRRLGTSMRILTDAAETGSANPAAPPANARNSGDAAAPFPALPPVSSLPVSQSSPANAAASKPPAVPAAEEPAAPAAEPAPPPPTEPVNPEVSVTAANGLPDMPANAAQPQSGSFQLKLTSRLVDVGIVAYDKKGHAVKDLKAEDFEVYDNGRKQDVRFFSQFASETAAAPPADAAPDRTFSNRAKDVAAAPATTASETGATVLLIDESHIAWPDLSHARQEVLKFLGTVAPGERVGLYTMTDLGFRVVQEITTDHAALTAKLQKWMPAAQSVSQAQEEETRNRQSFNEVHSVADLNSVNGNQTQVPDYATPVDPQLLSLGSNPARAALIILSSVARHLSAFSGRKNLVWVSSDNVFADWESQAVGIDKSPKNLDSFALHAQEVMNDAHVAVFPLDVSQLETSAVTADIQHRNVELTQAAADSAALGGAAVPRNMTNGRNTAEMQQDMHPIQGSIRQVADATGGRIIRRSGDLAAALAGIVEDGHATYVVSFYPQGPADDQYHAITVKLTGKQHGLTLRYRTGYLYSKDPATLKDRFRQAVWRPLDVSEIAVTAGVIPANSGAKITLDILTADLGLQQQTDRWMDKLDIFFIQRDDAGIHARVEGQTIGLRLKSATYQSLLASGVPFEHVVQMKPGMASLRVLLVDENNGRMGSVTIPAPALAGSQ